LIQHVTGRGFAEVLRMVADALGIGDGDAPPPPPTAPRVHAPAKPEKRTELAPEWAARWQKARPITADCPAGRYLTGRGCALPPADGDLRWHPQVKHWKADHIGPALIALVTAAVTGRARTLHFTWIAPDGSRKADLGEHDARLVLPGHSNVGVVRLWPDQEVTTGLLVGEGIESALTAAHGFTPVWATLNAGNLAKLPPLPGVEALTIVADHDRAGLDAAEACARRWTDTGHEVRIWTAAQPGADPNDKWGRHAA
jgi:hypothetical protein